MEHSKVNDQAVAVHECQRQWGHFGWHQCWCELVFDEIGLIGLDRDLFHERHGYIDGRH